MTRFRSLIDSLIARMGGESDSYKTEWRPDREVTFSDIRSLLPESIRIGLWSGNCLVDEFGFAPWQDLSDKRVWLVWFDDGAVCVDLYK